MGDLNIHNLNQYIDKYNCNIFIETGSGIGDGIGYATTFRFSKLFSIEIMEELFNRVTKRFQHNDKCKIIHSNSIEGLHKILKSVSKEDSIFFWLDAHFPGADFQLASYEDEHPLEIKAPLLHELEIILSYRKGCKDVYMIDDLNVYEEGEYQLGNSRFFGKFGDLISFVKTHFSLTHTIQKDYRHQGFLILQPK